MLTIDQPKLVDECIAKSLASMDPKLVKNAVAIVIESNPDVSLVLANSALLESKNLNLDQMSGNNYWKKLFKLDETIKDKKIIK